MSKFLDRLVLGVVGVGVLVSPGIVSFAAGEDEEPCTVAIMPYYGHLTPGGVPNSQGGTCYSGCSDQHYVCVSGSAFKSCKNVTISTVCFVGTLSQNQDGTWKCSSGSLPTPVQMTNSVGVGACVVNP